MSNLDIHTLKHVKRFNFDMVVAVDMDGTGKDIVCGNVIGYQEGSKTFVEFRNAHTGETEYASKECFHKCPNDFLKAWLIEQGATDIPAPAPEAKEDTKEDAPGTPVGMTDDEGVDFDPEMLKDLDDAKSTKSVIRPRNHYVLHDVRTSGGRKAYDIDDPVAGLFRGLDIAECYTIVAQIMEYLEVEELGRGSKTFTPTRAGLFDRYGHLNLGMQRMNLGNIVRGQLKALDIELSSLGSVLEIKGE